MSEKSKAFVIFSVSRLGPVPGPLGLLRRNVNTVKPDNSSTRLSPPKASSAKLPAIDRKSTRLNSSHLGISYAVFCLKKKKTTRNRHSEKQNQRTQQKAHRE